MTETPPPREALEAAESMIERLELRSPCPAAYVKQDLARAFARYHADGLRRMAERVDAGELGGADDELVQWLMTEAARHAPEAEGE